MKILYANNASSVLASGISDTDTSLTVLSGNGSLFPTITGSDIFLVTLKSQETSNLEIIKVTARTNDTFTIERAQEGTQAQSFITGDSVEMLITAGHFEDLRDQYLTHPSSCLSSLAPTNNGDLVFEATSNTSLTVKYKGSDGTVRSGTITLA